jgi:membrane-associated phospholipid phosphatase
MDKHISNNLLGNNKPFLIGFFLLLIGFSILQILFTQGELIFWVNRHYSDGLDSFFKYATKLGEDYWYILIIVYLLLIKNTTQHTPKERTFSFVSQNKLLLIFIIMWVLKVLLSTSLKYLFNAPRPMGVYGGKGLTIHLVSGVNIHTAQSFPSGHTMTAFALACFLSLIVKNKLWGILFLVLAILVAYSRVYLFQHFPKDVFAGAILGVFVVFIAFYALKWLPLKA